MIAGLALVSLGILVMGAIVGQEEGMVIAIMLLAIIWLFGGGIYMMINA
jgi:hypothetical protein